jgi:hypothetical protein
MSILAANSPIYWKQTADTLWSSSSNWYQNALCTTPASRIPASGDSIYLTGTVAPTTGPTAAITVPVFDTSAMVVSVTAMAAAVTYKSAGSIPLIIVTQTLNFGDAGGSKANVWQGTATTAGMSITFRGASQVSAVVGTANFYDSSYTTQSVGSGSCFYNTSHITGVGAAQTVPSATFNDSSYMGSGYASLSGTTTFNGASYCNGATGGSNSITGTVIWNSTGYFTPALFYSFGAAVYCYQQMKISICNTPWAGTGKICLLRRDQAPKLTYQGVTAPIPIDLSQCSGFVDQVSTRSL